MNRRFRIGIACIVLMLPIAANAFAETSDLSIRKYPERNRSSRGGFEGRTMLRLHAGISTPTGDLDNLVNTGWGLGASLGYGVGRNTVLSWGVAYHHFGEELADGRVAITPVTMSVDYGFSSSGSVRPWVSGGLGLYHVSEKVTEFVAPNTFVISSDEENDFGLNFGFGIATPLSPRSTFGTGFKFHHVVGDRFIDANFVTIQAGLAYPL
ncbi:MAG: porin family protein [Candidatus Eisenbacteria bacterium]|uniref:Porin family protein n=1 Tax=Eiseniibacteriota bacterium TaxID=2212470 RepID=A0A538TDU5_UNCEI|nr:MAG: porin family protein [Candidatus Eisenbacteria bacterium]